MTELWKNAQVTADSIYDALHYHVSHKKDYKSFEMRKQFAYYLAKHPDVFQDIVADELQEGESYESFIMNMFHGLSLPKLNVICAIFVKMWNTPVNVVYPSGVEKKIPRCWRC